MGGLARLCSSVRGRLVCSVWGVGEKTLEELSPEGSGYGAYAQNPPQMVNSPGFVQRTNFLYGVEEGGPAFQQECPEQTSRPASVKSPLGQSPWPPPVTPGPLSLSYFLAS